MKKKIPLKMHIEIFYPLAYYLGFEEHEGEAVFSLSLLFAYFVVRLCNKLGDVFIDKQNKEFWFEEK